MSDFQRRQYETLAKVIERAYKRASEDACEDAQYAALDALTTDLANELGRDNPNFNRVRFFQAADATEWEGELP